MNYFEEKLDAILTEMHYKLDQLIECHNFDLQNSEIQKYSQELDKIILLYTKNIMEQKGGSFKLEY